MYLSHSLEHLIHSLKFLTKSRVKSQRKNEDMLLSDHVTQHLHSVLGWLWPSGVGEISHTVLIAHSHDHFCGTEPLYPSRMLD